MAEPREAVRIAISNWQETISKRDFVLEISHNVLLEQGLMTKHEASADYEAAIDAIHKVKKENGRQ